MMYLLQESGKEPVQNLKVFLCDKEIPYLFSAKNSNEEIKKETNPQTIKEILQKMGLLNNV